jgi:hypothetical protein
LRAVRAGLVAATLMCACRAPTPSEGPSSLGGDAARVGTTNIPVAVVSAVFRASSQSVRKALDSLVADALAAAGARNEDLARKGGAPWATSAVLARRVALQSIRDAAAEGPPKPDELEDVRVVHAVVMRSARVPEARAVAVADAIRRAVEGSRSADEFEKRANATPHADAQVTVERLAPFGADGRWASGEGGAVDGSFAAAAFGLRVPAQVSPVVETRFGWHVIFLMDRSAPQEAAGAATDRRTDLASLASAVEEMRARGWIESRLRTRRRASHIEILGDADALIAEVKVP